jgi:uncharacterized protein YlaN (UPF0358 family)
MIWLLQPLKVDPAEYRSLPKTTAKGNPYEHNLEFVDSETKKPVLIYLCEKELEEEWNKRSTISYHGKTIQGNPISHTLIRYLASKHLTRDAEGVEKLSETDIKNVQLGRPSIHYSGLMARMHALRFELNYAENPNGHSLLQRFEYWKAGLNIASNNWLIGVGAGDSQAAFNRFYEQTNSPLSEENRSRSHNQFLSNWISFGILGLILFMGLLIFFVRFNYQQKSILALLFISIAIVSFFMEDTLETQTGVTFFGLFLGLFITPTLAKSSSTSLD